MRSLNNHRHWLLDTDKHAAAIVEVESMYGRPLLLEGVGVDDEEKENQDGHQDEEQHNEPNPEPRRIFLSTKPPPPTSNSLREA